MKWQKCTRPRESDYSRHRFIKYFCNAGKSPHLPVCDLICKRNQNFLVSEAVKHRIYTKGEMKRYFELKNILHKNGFGSPKLVIIDNHCLLLHLVVVKYIFRNASFHLSVLFTEIICWVCRLLLHPFYLITQIGFFPRMLATFYTHLHVFQY